MHSMWRKIRGGMILAGALAVAFLAPAGQAQRGAADWPYYRGTLAGTGLFPAEANQHRQRRAS